MVRRAPFIPLVLSLIDNGPRDVHIVCYVICMLAIANAFSLSETILIEYLSVAHLQTYHIDCYHNAVFHLHHSNRPRASDTKLFLLPVDLESYSTLSFSTTSRSLNRYFVSPLNPSHRLLNMAGYDVPNPDLFLVNPLQYTTEPMAIS